MWISHIYVFIEIVLYYTITLLYTLCICIYMFYEILFQAVNPWLLKSPPMNIMSCILSPQALAIMMLTDSPSKDPSFLSWKKNMCGLPVKVVRKNG